MKIFKVKIISVKTESFWYADKVGEEFYVYKVRAPFSKGLSYEVVMEGTWDSVPVGHYLTETDLEFIGEPFEADIVTEVKVSIKKI